MSIAAPAIRTRAWTELGRSERALVRNDFGLALATASSSRLGGLDSQADDLVRRIRHRVAGTLPAFPGAELCAAMEPVAGWFTAAEAGLLARAAAVAASSAHPLVEIGSYCGRSTVVLALVLAAAAPETSYRRLVAIDPHQDYAPAAGLDTYSELLETLRRNDVHDVVRVVRARSVDVELPPRAALVFVDGLHDEDSVRADLEHVEPHLPPGALLALHDYRPDYPGVVAAADQFLRGGQFDVVGFVESLLVLRRRPLPRTTTSDRAPLLLTTSPLRLD